MRTVLKIVVIALIMVGLFVRPELSLADGGIVVTSNTHQNQYPTKISFELKANSTAQITKVKFTYRLLGDPTTSYAYPEDFTAGKSITTTYELNTQKTYLPPEVSIQYYWDIEDASGNRLRTEPATFSVSDTRFQWRKIEEGNIAIMWYKGDEAFARKLLSMGTEAIAQLSKDEGIVPTQQIKILAYASHADLLGALGPDANEWTGGVSFSEQSIIVLEMSPDASGLEFASRGIPHELSHVVVHQVTDNPYGDIPHWLDEGLAMYNEGELESNYSSSLAKAVTNNKLLSLQTLSSNFSPDSDEALLSYAESYSVVNYIVDTYGRDGLAKLLKVFSEGSTYDDAVKAALNVQSVKDLEVAWKISLGIDSKTASAGVTPNATPASANSGKPTTIPTSSSEKSTPCGALPFGFIALSAVALGMKRFRP